jgi:hypothetical protein
MSLYIICLDNIKIQSKIILRIYLFYIFISIFLTKNIFILLYFVFSKILTKKSLRVRNLKMCPHAVLVRS